MFVKSYAPDLANDLTSDVSANQTTLKESVSVNTLRSTPAGTTMGLKESECGQMGVIMMAGTLGWIIEAPAATAYAVLPVGVDTITPEGTQRHMHTVN